MSARHTPGPWILATDKGCPVQILGAPTDKDPEYNPITRSGTTFICPTSPETLANARLIAAAPELLQSLQMLMRFAPNDSEECQYTKGVWRDAAAAISKATGEESP